jgi:hypothetical protein
MVLHSIILFLLFLKVIIFITKNEPEKDKKPALVCQSGNINHADTQMTGPSF